MNKKKQQAIYVGVILSSLAVGFLVGYQIKSGNVSTPTQAIRENVDQYRFIHPLLSVGRPNISIPTPLYASLQKKVDSFIFSQKASDGLDTASVYFINYGEKSGSFAINEKEKYPPASLLKVVVMFAYLKESDTNPKIMQKELVYNPSVAQGLNAVIFESPSDLTIGKSYKVEELIEKMIVDSDNGAMNLLLANIDDRYLDSVYLHLGLNGPEEKSSYMISVEDYSLFLRILYNSTYLSELNSEKALSILSRAVFSDGIVAGLPKDITVAHKFGEHVNGTYDRISSIELHDCGFVYAHNNPYLLCIMTRGKNLQGLKNTISGISKIVYINI